MHRLGVCESLSFCGVGGEMAGLEWCLGWGVARFELRVGGLRMAMGS